MNTIHTSSAEIIDLQKYQKRTATSAKLDWLDAVMADHRLGASAKVVAFCIMQHVNDEAGTAYVSDLTISHKTGISERWVRTGRNELRSASWISWTRKTRTDANIYSTLTGPMADIAAQQLELRKQRKEMRMQRREWRPSAGPTSDDRKSSAVHERKPSAVRDRHPSADIHLSTYPLDVPLKESRYMAATDSVLVPAMEPMAADFETFWQQYPRKVGKLQAEKTYTRIITSKQASAAELLAGAGRYAAAMASKEPRFIKHPGTWLNAGCWTDEPEPPPKPKISTRLNGVASGMRGYFEDRYNDKK